MDNEEDWIGVSRHLAFHIVVQGSDTWTMGKIGLVCHDTWPSTLCCKDLIHGQWGRLDWCVTTSGLPYCGARI